MADFKHKLIIRNLPIDFTKENLDNLLGPWSRYISYTCLIGGKGPGRLFNKQVRNSVAYVSFTIAEKLLEFITYIQSNPLSYSENASGEVYERDLQIELAPSQLAPKYAKYLNSSNDDIINEYCNTLSDNKEFLTFVASLETAETDKTPLDLDKMADGLMAKDKELSPWKYENKEAKKATPKLDFISDVEKPQLNKLKGALKEASPSEPSLKEKKNKTSSSDNVSISADKKKRKQRSKRDQNENKTTDISLKDFIPKTVKKSAESCRQEMEILADEFLSKGKKNTDQKEKKEQASGPSLTETKNNIITPGNIPKIMKRTVIPVLPKEAMVIPPNDNAVTLKENDFEINDKHTYVFSPELKNGSQEKLSNFQKKCLLPANEVTEVPKDMFTSTPAFHDVPPKEIHIELFQKVANDEIESSQLFFIDRSGDSKKYPPINGRPDIASLISSDIGYVVNEDDLAKSSKLPEKNDIATGIEALSISDAMKYGKLRTVETQSQGSTKKIQSNAQECSKPISPIPSSGSNNEMSNEKQNMNPSKPVGKPSIIVRKFTTSSKLQKEDEHTSTQQHTNIKASIEKKKSADSIQNETSKSIEKLTYPNPLEEKYSLSAKTDAVVWEKKQNESKSTVESGVNNANVNSDSKKILPKMNLPSKNNSSDNKHKTPKDAKVVYQKSLSVEVIKEDNISPVAVDVKKEGSKRLPPKPIKLNDDKSESQSMKSDLQKSPSVESLKSSENKKKSLKSSPKSTSNENGSGQQSYLNTIEQSIEILNPMSNIQSLDGSKMNYSSVYTRLSKKAFVDKSDVVEKDNVKSSKDPKKPAEGSNSNTYYVRKKKLPPGPSQ